MAKGIKIITLVLGLVVIALGTIYAFFESAGLLTALLSVGVTFYHFAMRLIVGCVINGIFHNKIDYKKWWFCERKFEKPLYKFLKVKKWKKFMPTFSADTFSMEKHSLSEIAGATCQAEIVHETIIALSFLPIIACAFFGEVVVFVITSVVAGLLDLVFVIMQRFNRPRIVALIKMQERKKLS